MDIQILRLLEGARQARGLTVVIDVFRAFSVDAYLFAGGAERIIPVAGIETAHQLKEDNPEAVMVGEREGRIIQGFDYHNSPSQIEDIDFSGKTVIHTTSAGTQGLVRATEAAEIITGAFVNIGAIIDYIRKREPGIVSLVAMGNSGIQPADEDEFCARYIKNSLTGNPINFADMKEQLRKGSGRRFFDPDKDWSPEADFQLCLDRDRFDFVIRARGRGEGKIELIAVSLSSPV